MPSFLSTLSKSARTAFPIIQRAVREALSIRAIQNAIKEEFGQGINNTTLAQIVRREREVVNYGIQLDELPGNRLINVNKLPEALRRQRTRYSFTVEVDGILGNGMFGTQSITVNSDSPLTPNEIRDLAEEAAEFGGEGSGVSNIEGSTIVSGTRVGAAGLL